MRFDDIGTVQRGCRCDAGSDCSGRKFVTVPGESHLHWYGYGGGLRADESRVNADVLRCFLNKFQCFFELVEIFR